MNKQKNYIPPGVERRRIVTEGIIAGESFTRSVSGAPQYYDDYDEVQSELPSPNLIIN
jgi:hypothetical protein